MPAAKISKVIDPDGNAISGYMVTLEGQKELLVVEGFYPTLDEVFTVAFRNRLGFAVRSWITISLAVDGPVTLGLDEELKQHSDLATSFGDLQI